MTPRVWIEGGLILLVLLAGWGFMHQRDNRLRAEGRLELELARADSTARAAAELVAASERRDSAAAAAIARAEEGRAAAERRASNITRKITPAADSVVLAAAPSDSTAVRARLDELVALYEERDRARLEQLAAADQIIAELRALDVTRLAAIRSLETALSAAQAATETALEARPGWLERNGPRVLIPLAFVAGWVLSAQLGG